MQGNCKFKCGVNFIVLCGRHIQISQGTALSEDAIKTAKHLQRAQAISSWTQTKSLCVHPHSVNNRLRFELLGTTSSFVTNWGGNLLSSLN